MRIHKFCIAKVYHFRSESDPAVMDIIQDMENGDSQERMFLDALSVTRRIVMVKKMIKVRESFN